MSYENIQKDKLAIKDQLGDLPETSTVGIWNYNEQIKIEELSTIISTRLLYSGTGDSFILGHSVNGVLGTATGIGGNQVLLGDYGTSSIRQRVLNPSNTYREFFRNTDFKSGTTNANWDTTNHKLLFTFPTGSIAQSEIFALNSETYYTVKFSLVGDDTTNLILYVSFDAGVHFEQVTASTAYVTGTPNSTGLVWRVESTGSGTMTHLKIEYG